MGHVQRRTLKYLRGSCGEMVYARDLKSLGYQPSRFESEQEHWSVSAVRTVLRGRGADTLMRAATARRPKSLVTETTFSGAY